MTPKLLDVDDFKKLLDKLPDNLKWDLVGFACDIVGIVHPAGDVAGAVISLWRGDLFGAAISAISIIPIGDILKVAKLSRYPKIFKELLEVLFKDVDLLRGMEPAMDQVRTLLNKIPSGKVREIDDIRATVKRYFDRLDLARTASKARNLPGVVRGGAKLPQVTDPVKWLYQGNQARLAVKIPKEIGEKLIGREFQTFADLQSALWREFGKHPEFAKAFGFDPSNAARMASGSAPLIPKDATRSLFVVDPTGATKKIGELPNPRATDKLGRIKGGEESYALHHMTPIHDGGGVYDLDNLLICTPLYHSQGHLTPKYHYGR